MIKCTMAVNDFFIVRAGVSLSRPKETSLVNCQNRWKKIPAAKAVRPQNKT